MKIIGLYEYDDVYQVFDDEEEMTCHFQGSYRECAAYAQMHMTATMKIC